MYNLFDFMYLHNVVHSILISLDITLIVLNILIILLLLYTNILVLLISYLKINPQYGKFFPTILIIVLRLTLKYIPAAVALGNSFTRFPKLSKILILHH